MAGEPAPLPDALAAHCRAVAARQVRLPVRLWLARVLSRAKSTTQIKTTEYAHTYCGDCARVTAAHSALKPIDCGTVDSTVATLPCASGPFTAPHCGTLSPVPCPQLLALRPPPPLQRARAFLVAARATRPHTHRAWVCRRARCRRRAAASIAYGLGAWMRRSYRRCPSTRYSQRI